MICIKLRQPSIALPLTKTMPCVSPREWKALNPDKTENVRKPVLHF